jgi:DNA replicative helicase MCM subunit Mcm2 (Cdc46/Mcm family)
MLKKVARRAPNLQYADGQSSTGLSLTTQISREKDCMLVIQYGPMVLGKNAVCVINEIGQLSKQEHKHLLDCMEENGFPIPIYGLPTFVEAHPSIIAAANPVNIK